MGIFPYIILGHKNGANLGIHIPAPWIRHGIVTWMLPPSRKNPGMGQVSASNQPETIGHSSGQKKQGEKKNKIWGWQDMMRKHQKGMFKCFTPRNLTNIWKYAAPAVLVKCQCSNSKSKVWTVATNAQKHGTLKISRTNTQAREQANKPTHTFRGVDW